MPITVALIARVRAVLKPSSLDDHCLMAAFSFATAGLLRGKEFAAVPGEPDRIPLVRDLTLATESATLRLRTSKTDPFGRGALVRVAQPAAISDLHRYISMRTTLEPSAPLFAMADGQPLHLRRANAALRALLQRAGVDLAGWRGLSFRRGGATSLTEAGIPDHIIKELGRWRSWVYSTYIEASEQHLLLAAASI
jgi:hypothetical protein